MADEDILIKLSLDANALIEGARASQKEIDAIKTKLLEISKTAKVSFEVAANTMKQSLTGSREEIAKTSQNINIARRQLESAYGPANAFASAINKIGKAMQIAFGIGIYQLIRQLVSGFGELIAAGEEYAKALYKLGASVRSLQKQGLDITIAGALNQIKQLRQEFGVFSTKDLVAGVAQVQLLTRNFGFTNDQTLQLTRSIAALSVVLGKDFENTASSVALFLSSGYGESLQRAGIAVNRLAVVQEANRMGIEKSYTALTEVERAQAAYNLVVAQSADLVSELTNYQKTYLGQLETQRAQVEDLKNALALGLIPADLAWQKIRLTGINAIIQGLNLLLTATGYYIAIWIAGIAEITMAWKNFQSLITGKGIAFTLTDMARVIADAFNQMQQEIEKVKIKPLDLDQLLNFTGIDAAAQAAAEKQNESADQILKVMTDLVDELLKIQEDYANQSKKLWDNYVEDRNKIIADASQDLIDRYDDLLKDLAKLENDYNKSVAKAQADAQKRLANLAKDTRNKIIDSNKKYHDNEEKAERDHQERLRRLREEFLFDLEDALRERDALQVLRLIRRYNLDKAQEERANQDRLDELKKQHQDELVEIKKSEADKRQEIQQSLQEQLADLRANYEERVTEREAQYQEDINKINENLQKELQARKDQYDEELAQLQESFWGSGGKLEEILTQWAKTNSVTEEQAKAVTDVLEKYFGKLGITDSIFNYYKSAVAGIVSNVLEQERLLQLAAADALALQQQITNAATAAATSVASLASSLQSLGVAGAGGLNIPYNPYNQISSQPGGHASGYSTIVTRPQLMTVGEYGIPEQVNVTPLNQLNSRGGNGTGKLEILLGAGLEGRIVDNALGQVEIVLRKELDRK